MAKFTIQPGTYAAGDAIPLIGTVPRCGSIYHDSGSPVIQIKGSGCPCNPARYAVGVGITFTTIGVAPEQVALLEDGVRVTGGLISVDAAAAAEVVTASIPNEVSAVTSARLALEAVTPVKITDGAVVVYDAN